MLSLVPQVAPAVIQMVIALAINLSGFFNKDNKNVQSRLADGYQNKLSL